MYRQEQDKVTTTEGTLIIGSSLFRFTSNTGVILIDLTADPQIRIPQAPLRLRDEVVEAPTSSVDYLNTLLTGFNDGISVEKLGYGVQRLEISGAIPKPITVTMLRIPFVLKFNVDYSSQSPHA